MSSTLGTTAYECIDGSDPPYLGVNLSTRIRIVWRRGKARANRLIGNAPPEVRTTHESTCCFPYEIVEMIIAHLVRDFGTLKVCALTCRSWNIAAVPRLHHTLVLRQNRPGTTHHELEPLSKLYELGFMPHVKEIQVRQMCSLRPWFVPQAFTPDPPYFRYFATFPNVQTLKLQNMNIYYFLPCIERFFGQFSPTLQSITLFESRCTPRQLSHFLSLFPNLDNVEIWRISTDVPNPAVIPDAELALFSTPKLGGGVGPPRVPLDRDLGLPHRFVRRPTVPLYGPTGCSRLCVHPSGGMCRNTRDRTVLRG